MRGKSTKTCMKIGYTNSQKMYSVNIVKAKLKE